MNRVRWEPIVEVMVLTFGLAAPVAAAPVDQINAGWADDGTVVRLRTSTDSVGIGTATPSGKLHVTGGNAIFEGNVGIGTTSPGDKLEVHGSGAVKIRLKNSGPSGANYTLFVTDSASGYGANKLVIEDIGGSLVPVAISSGNVGIGTTTPAQKLHVVGSARITGLVSCNTIDTNALGDLVCGTDEGGGGIGGSGTTNFVPKFTAATTLGNSLIFDNGTNVGIGTTAPGAKLHVAGSGITRLLVSSSDNNPEVVLRPGGTATDPLLVFQNAAGAEVSRIQGNVAVLMLNGPEVGFRIGGVDKVRIDETGNVGIGTTAPTEKLQVDGTVHSTSGGFRFPDGTVQLTANGANAWIANGSHIYSSNPGNVGIGTSAPEMKLDVVGNGLIRSEGESVLLFVQTFSSLAPYHRPAIHFLKARGTKAAPQPVVAGDNLWSLEGSGFDGANFDYGGGLHTLVSGVVGGVVETELRFETANQAAGGGRTVMTINKDGRVFMPALANCNTIDTDASGLLFCGTDETGGGGGGGVTSLNSTTGDLQIVGGGSATVTTSGNTITVSTPTCTPFNSPIECTQSGIGNVVCSASCPTDYIITSWACDFGDETTVDGNTGSCFDTDGFVHGAGNCQKSC